MLPIGDEPEERSAAAAELVDDAEAESSESSSPVYRLPYFYLMPKIIKPEVKYRPIMSYAGVSTLIYQRLLLALFSRLADEREMGLGKSAHVLNQWWVIKNRD